jgi:glycine dehydrogenase subunit 2
LESRGDARKKVLIPDSAHGTNPATAAIAGYEVEEIASNSQGMIDLEALERAVDDSVAALMVTNPNTVGIFEKDIAEAARILHAKGAQLYMDGANMNALVGIARPGDFGVDAMHLNLHKTFSTPHGGGGPGSGAVGVGTRLMPFLPIPIVGKREDNGDPEYFWLTEEHMPQSIGRLSGFMGNAGVLLRAYVYMRMLGRDGMRRIAEFATLNANYLMARLEQAGFELAYPGRRASHEFIVTLKRQSKSLNLTAMDVAKALLDHGFHAPTTYFPLLVPECLLIEPTETETREMMDRFADAMIAIVREAETDIRRLKGAPYTMPVRRLDDVKAARNLDLAWKPSQTP